MWRKKYCVGNAIIAYLQTQVKRGGEFVQNLVERIYALCKERGLSMKSMEEAAGVAVGTVGRWGTHTPSVDKVKRVADFLGVTVDYLLRDIPDTPGE